MLRPRLLDDAPRRAREDERAEVGLEDLRRHARRSGAFRAFRPQAIADAGTNASRSTAPLLGTVTAGQPILAQEEISGYVPFEIMGEDKLFALNVRGDSMIGAGILDGDTVIVRIQQSARSGEIVVALINDEATVKRLSLKNGVWLMPENPAYDPIDGSECKILGKVIALYRDNVR